jgi:hypothetical protein
MGPVNNLGWSRAVKLWKLVSAYDRRAKKNVPKESSKFSPIKIV